MKKVRHMAVEKIEENLQKLVDCFILSVVNRMLHGETIEQIEADIIAGKSIEVGHNVGEHLEGDSTAVEELKREFSWLMDE